LEEQILAKLEEIRGRGRESGGGREEGRKVRREREEDGTDGGGWVVGEDDAVNAEGDGLFETRVGGTNSGQARGGSAGEREEGREKGRERRRGEGEGR
jgi:hypothetical protein